MIVIEKSTDIEVGGAMNRHWVAVQRNPQSGSGRRQRELIELKKGLRREGLRSRFFSCRTRLNEALNDSQLRERLLCIVAAGGDGTVRDVINRFPGQRVAVLPLGTENLLARYLRTPFSGRRVAEMIAAGRTRRLDLCTIGEQRFALMASFGFDADVVHRTHSRRTGHISRFSYFQPIVQSLRKYQYPELSVYADDSPRPLRARLAVVMNLPVYAFGLRVANSARGDDGLLDLRIFQRGSSFQMMRYMYKVAVGRHEALDDVQAFQAAQIRIESDQPVPAQVDGDPAGFTPQVVKMLPGALEVFVLPSDS